ncbi:LysM peptidoglycan-binding domain-containing protein [Kangiella sp. HZ709]|uniref:LysM peptidoglycan-binding domain-containing protein n=1 Tax=Kangiella sp. HZ709 TaxID=2666328 RepID=UPI0018A218D5
MQDRSEELVQVVDATESSSHSSTKPKNEVRKSVTPQEYVVKKNDTLGSIARKTLGSSIYYRQLASFNSLNEQQTLKVGQVILIPTNISVSQTTKATPLKRPSTSTKEPLIIASQKYPELNSLISQQKYNQAIDWALTHPNLKADLGLQAKLVEATSLQADKELEERDYSEASFLINGLKANQNLAGINKTQLTRKATQIQCNQLSHNALQKVGKGQIDEAYKDLMQALSLDKNYSNSLDLFLQARDSVTETMHQEALKLYRNQQLDKASILWSQILKLKPNDDLALVYTDRVKSLQKKLKGL